MEVMPGYKQTEVGVIPEDWDDPQLEAIAKDDSPICYGIVQVGPHTRNGVPVLAIKNLNSDYATNVHKASPEIEGRYARSRVHPDDVLVSVKGTTGRVGIVPSGFHGNISRDLARLRLREGIVPRFCFQMLQSDLAQRRLAVAVVGTTRMELSIAILKKVRIPLPPTKAEQEAIAEVLSKADALIESLERLIAKKRLLKRGVMQKLLRPKEGWKVTNLGDMGSTFGGLAGKAKSDFGVGPARYITFMNVMTNVVIDCTAFEHVKVSPDESQNLVMKGDLFFNGSSETPEEVGMCSVLLDEVQNVFLNSFCFGFRFRNRDEANGLYLAYFFRSGEGRRLLKPLAQGATRYNLSKTSLLRVAFPMPPFPEQIAIASILSAMDAEIALLEAQLAKYRQLKQGLMQKLLTGRIRPGMKESRRIELNRIGDSPGA